MVDERTHTIIHLEHPLEQQLQGLQLQVPPAPAAPAAPDKPDAESDVYEE
jgi:hypothetical protein